MAEVQILGHKAKIVRISPMLRGKDDMLMVQVEFAPHFDSIISTGIFVPLTAGAGSREEFLEAVVNEGTGQVEELLRLHQADRERQLAQTRRRDEVNLVVQRLSQELGLDV